jgi:putative hydrolase of the HAD superfamily
MTMAEPAAVFFDMDGTILDWQLGMEESWQIACRDGCAGREALDADALFDAIRERRTWFWDDDVRATTGRLDLDAASRAIVAYALEDLGHASVALAETIARDYRTRRVAQMAPYPGAMETLTTLRARGIPMALITNGGATAQRDSIERFGLAQYFGCIIVEEEFGCGKPDERVFRHALATLGCVPEDTWMVGDNLEADIATPLQLGMHTIWVDGATPVPGRAAHLRPHRTVRAIAELFD